MFHEFQPIGGVDAKGFSEVAISSPSHLPSFWIDDVSMPSVASNKAAKNTIPFTVFQTLTFGKVFLLFDFLLFH
jgi:hypothetical protein